MFFYQISTLTEKIDIIPSASENNSGDDLIIGDKTTTQASDQVDGGTGDDTFHFFGANGKDAATLVVPTLKSVENLIFTENNSTDIKASTIEGLKTLTLDKHDLAANTTVALAGQAVAVKAPVVADNDILTFASTADTVLDLTLDGFTPTSGTATIAITGTKVATLDLTAMGKDSEFTLTNAGAALKTVNIDGDGAVEITSTLDTITTVNASKNSGGVDIALGASDLTFTGGAGDDTITFATGDLTAKDILDGGTAGVDTIVINDTTPVYATINAAKGFEVLGLGTTGATVAVDKLTTINSFEVLNTGTTTFTGSKDSTLYSVDNSGTTTAINITNALGHHTVNVDINNSTAASHTITKLDLHNATVVNLTSSGTAGNVITDAIANGDNSSITIKGDADLTLTAALAATATGVGSTVNAQAFTGKLTVTGSDKTDIIKGGSGDDTITTGGGADTLTGGEGADTFAIKIAAGTNAFGKDNMATITDFNHGGVDKIALDAKGTTFATSITALTTAVTDTDTFDAALNKAAFSDGATNGVVTKFEWKGDTYVVYDCTDGGTFTAASDVVVKLTGTNIDLTSGAFADHFTIS